MDVHARLAQLRTMVGQARTRPRSTSVLVDRDDLLAAIDGLAAELDRAGLGSADTPGVRQAAVAEGRAEADRILSDARREREKLLSDTDVHRVAKREAEDLLTDARSRADGLRREADEYVDTTLAHFEVTLDRTREEVRRGRQRLAGRNAFDEPGAAADEIALPDHLDG